MKILIICVKNVAPCDDDDDVHDEDDDAMVSCACTWSICHAKEK